ncbi:YraN family protein [Pendulispora albinea]|uniref:YraN family protein n=1 Tax=Pendulispora albinea TaxID=2741071 RepID=A0ABZ2M5K6_9BACT
MQAQGFAIVARNLKLGRLEIDIVARRDALAVMVEVRARGRTAFERPLASVAGRKRMHLVRAAERLWRLHLAKVAGVERMRIDVAGVTFGRDGVADVEYIAGAITA